MTEDVRNSTYLFEQMNSFSFYFIVFDIQRLNEHQISLSKQINDIY